ncbi:pyrroline-5-carboxylate reductase [Mesobacillus foraminis]|uniref:pyrroline-5-carboxylate reductase n=1 Tax=Mesobacillus foraminis TaxID=279826 RepID=UPI001BE77C28|nr:pyrroline-5-carboxylate reductase [Mesobacillus foraminis]MBT2754821.1 pyrroline-5-carboxylate reductase [Mesobacillus foraminis]
MKKLVFIGAGAMAEALMSGIIENKLLGGGQVWVTNRQNQKRLDQLKASYGVNASYKYDELFRDADAVILAMKPKDAASAIAAFTPFLSDGLLVISVLAGVSSETIEKAAGRQLAVARAMPNTSAAVNKSATAISTNERVTESQKGLAKELFDTVGLTAFVKEQQLDAVTGLSGSGPAYIYYLVEAMEKSAAEIGIEQQLAKALIVQTLLGAAEMLTKSEKDSKQLRMEVTSPGGTTEAGISILEKYGVQDAMVACIMQAAAHSRKMGEMLSIELNKEWQPIKS